jgi:drug/metabolite transporter (DMT)-like permease
MRYEVDAMTGLGTILILLTVVALIAAFPTWRHSRNWGLLPSSSLGLVLVILVIIFVAGRI